MKLLAAALSALMVLLFEFSAPASLASRDIAKAATMPIIKLFMLPSRAGTLLL
jgi:hypothetical protein